MYGIHEQSIPYAEFEQLMSDEQAFFFFKVVCEDFEKVRLPLEQLRSRCL